MQAIGKQDYLEDVSVRILFLKRLALLKSSLLNDCWSKPGLGVTRHLGILTTVRCPGKQPAGWCFPEHGWKPGEESNSRGPRGGAFRKSTLIGPGTEIANGLSGSVTCSRFPWAAQHKAPHNGFISAHILFLPTTAMHVVDISPPLCLPRVLPADSCSSIHSLPLFF